MTDNLATATDVNLAHNYHPLPVTISSGEGAWVTDVEGKRYLDLLSAYSALNFGHGHPEILAAAHARAGDLARLCFSANHDAARLPRREAGRLLLLDIRGSEPCAR